MAPPIAATIGIIGIGLPVLIGVSPGGGATLEVESAGLVGKALVIGDSVVATVEEAAVLMGVGVLG
jgi:hypothetical protein